MFLVVDLAEQLCSMALGGDQVDVDSPAWPIRIPLANIHCWLSGPDFENVHSDDFIKAAANQIRTYLERSRVQATDVMLVLLSKTGRTHACDLARALGCRHFCIPRYPYMISPRGVVPAGILHEYSHYVEPKGMDWQQLRDAFVDLLEKAADDVQAARFEQDDSVVDRYIQLRWAGRQDSAIMPVELLSDPQWLINAFIHASRERGIAELSNDSGIEMLSFHVRCAVELPEMFPRPIPVSDGRIQRALIPLRDASLGPCYDRNLLLAGDHGIGPACIRELDSSIPIHLGWSWRNNGMGQLICRSE